MLSVSTEKRQKFKESLFLKKKKKNDKDEINSRRQHTWLHGWDLICPFPVYAGCNFILFK